MLTTVRKCLRLLPHASRRQYLLLLPLSLVTGLAETAAAAGIFAVSAIVTDPVRALSIRWIAAIVHRLPRSGHELIVLQVAGMLAGLYIARSIVILTSQYFRIRVAHAANASLSCEMLRRYLSAAYPFHLRRNSSNLIRNCTTTVEQALGVVAAVAGLATDGLMAIGMAGVLVAMSPGLSLFAGIAVIAIVLVILKATRRAALRRGRGRHELSASMLQTLQQALGGVKELKVLGREQFFSDEFAARQREALQLGYLGVTIDTLPAVTVQTVLVCGALGLVVALTMAGQAGAQTLPIAAAFGYASVRILPMANNLVATLNHIRSSRPAVDELFDDFNALEAADREPEGAHLGFTQSIVLDAVSYTYAGGSTPAVAEMSITIRRGESIGIIGPTGAGKSTLVDLILGLLPPSSGRITVDGVDLAGTATKWKRRVGYVPQSIYLVDDTLRRNIALGIRDADIDDDRIRDVLAAARLHQFVAELPDGLSTRVGERGVRLSGGERQRVAIARALYHDPDVIIFDEATASLDVQTEAEITRIIAALRGVKTMVVIAHRLSSVKPCDRLVWLTRGRVVDVGSFDELRRRSAEFRMLTGLAAV